MSAPLTVLHIAANRWWTGSADPTIQLITGLRERGHRPFLAVIPGDRFESKAREAGVDLVDGVRLDTRLAPLGVRRDVARLGAFVRHARVQLIHAHHSHDHWIGWLTAARHRIPIVRTFHNRRAVKHGALSRWMHRRTAAVFTVSRQIESRCREVGIHADRLFWIPGAADLPRFGGEADGRAIREEFKLGDVPVIVSVSRLAPNRGHELLLAGFRLALAARPDVRLLLVGKGETRARLEQTVAEMGLTERVIFTGYRDRDLPAVLAAADCFALMAAGSDESCRAALEAMAAGRPVVAARAGALPETVVHGETGLLIDDARPERVAAALESVLGDRQRARAMGEAGRRRAEDVFAPQRSVDTVERVYRTLVDG